MMTETLASTILQASITGAGLIIAIYALITPIARRIFEERVELHRKKKKQFDKIKEKINEESSDKDFKRLKTLAAEIKGIKIFPRYLGVGVIMVFSFYIITALYAVGWLMSPSLEEFGWDYTLVTLFIFSTFGFLGVGYSAIIDVYRAMRMEYEQLKKEKEEVEKVSKTLGQLKEWVLMVVYRKRKGSDTWHWCKNCSTYPTENYEEITKEGKRPSYGELCNECRAKEKANDCK